MSTRANIASALASIGVLAIGWQVGTASGQTASTTSSATATTGTATNSAAARRTTTTSTTTTTPAAAATSASDLSDGTYAGATATNRFGSVTVTLTVAGGKITNVAAATTATDTKSAQINSRTVPVLKSAVLAAQSADITAVSGATYTTRSYVSSLQSALDKAGA